MQHQNHFYITTTLPYVNAEPHIGFALEILQADVLARYHSLLGDTVFFNTGTDEHGVKIYRKAVEQNKDPQQYVDEYAAKFKKLQELLNLWSGITYVRTTDQHHKQAAQEFWKRCMDRGDIYKKNYQVKYCVGCELEKTDSELEDGKCPIHPTYELEIIDEENYFFAFSAYQQKLLDFYKQNPAFVIPDYRFNEIKAFVERGLQDFSISRLKEKMPWGVEVPGDPDHVMYVWFDALVNYISTLGWPSDLDSFNNFWPGIQVAGKDNLRQQSAMWQAMLMSAGVPQSKQIYIHGFITAEGQKMSKSIGNVISPKDLVSKYGIDAVRYYLLGGLPAYDDGDYSTERFETLYNAELANGIGNLTSRILTMLIKYNESKVPDVSEDRFDTAAFWETYNTHLSDFRFDEAIRSVSELISTCDRLISDEKPWEKAKKGEDIAPLLYQLAECLRHIALALLPFIPESAEKILTGLGIQPKDMQPLNMAKIWGKLTPHAIISQSEILFARI